MRARLYPAYVIARRDFVATVTARSFILFLLAPLLIMGLSFLSATLTRSLAEQDERSAVAVIGTAAEFGAIEHGYERAAIAFPVDELPRLFHVRPGNDVPAQVKGLLGMPDKQVVAVLTGSLENPVLTGGLSEGGRISRQMTLIVDEARQQTALARARTTIPTTRIELVRVDETAGSLAAIRTATARAGQFALFFLTVFLAGMVLSQLIEEKSNKVIEVLTAAVPVDAIFFGKLFAMLAVSLLGITVWATAGLVGFSLWGEGNVHVAAPAVGWPAFILLGLIYFTFNYLLLGGIFLGLGSHAASPREVQTLSMPVTIGQVLVYFFATLAIGQPDGPIGIAAAIIPFSSPLAMIARAAQSADLWPHLLALVWQALWVWLVVRLGAGMFRRNVMKSGGGRASVPAG